MGIYGCKNPIKPDCRSSIALIRIAIGEEGLIGGMTKQILSDASLTNHPHLSHYIPKTIISHVQVGALTVWHFKKSG